MMRTDLKRFAKAGLLLSLLTVLTFAFQNCGNLQAIEDDEFDSTTLEPCSGSACTQSRERILVKIGNAPTIYLYPYANGTRDTAFDVAGFCDNGGFSETRIDWKLQDNAFNNVAVGPGPAAADAAKIRCDENGRFHFRVDLPPGYGYLKHTLVVTLLGIDEFSNEVGNPLTLNSDSRSVELFIAPVVGI